MTFFYDLNKRLADLATKQTLAEGKGSKPDFLDLDKDGNKKEPMKSAAKSKPFSKIVNKKDMDESALQAFIGKKKYGDSGMKALQKAGRDGASKDKMARIRAQHDKMDEAEIGDVIDAQSETMLIRALRAQGLNNKQIYRRIDQIMRGKAVDPREGARKTVAKEADMEEGNEFSGELVKARASGAKEFKVDGKSYPVKEAEHEVDESYAALDAYLKSREKEKGTGRFDKRERTLPSGMKATTYTRKPETFNDPETDPEATGGAPKRRGRPKGPEKGPERVTAKSYKYKTGRPAKEDLDTDGVMMTRASNMSSESVDRGEYDREGDMAKEQMHTIMSAAKELHRILGDDENLPEWVQKKITLAMEYIDTARDYMLTQHAERAEQQPIAEKAVSKKQQKFMGMVHAAQKGERPASGAVGKVAKSMGKKDAKDFSATKHKGLPEKVKEESTDKEDQHAERAGKRVTKDLEYDMKHKGQDDAKAERAGKRVAKDIEYDDKKDKVKESNKGGYNFGGGVYESINSQVEGIINEGMNVSVNMSTGQDGQPSKNITVSADGEDADRLAELLKMAGLGGQGSSCNTCGDTPCGCQTIDENSPDYPTNTETSNDALQYSGGLNGPKSTGQSTTPVLASQLRRQVSMEESADLELSLMKLYKEFK